MGNVKLPPLIITDFPGGYDGAIVEPPVVSMLGRSKFGADLEGNFHNIDHPVWNSDYTYCDNQHVWLALKHLLLCEMRDTYWKGRVPKVYGIRYTLVDTEAKVLMRYSDGEEKDDLTDLRDAFCKTPKISFHDALKLSREDVHRIWGVKVTQQQEESS